MASKYNLIEYDSEEERRLTPNPPLVNQISAARFIAGILRKGNVNYALMGGFAMIMRGSGRATRDVDIVTDATMKQLWNLIEIHDRLIIPDTRQLDGVIKIFVRTGSGHDNCTESLNVEVDLVTGGAKGTPRDVQAHTVKLPQISVDDETLIFQGLNLYYMLKIKLANCSGRAMPRDFTDVYHLVRTYPEAVQSMLDELSQDELETILNYEGFGKAQLELLRKVFGIES